MKRFNLILVLVFSLLSVQSVVAAENGSGPIKEGTTWYTTTYTSEFQLRDRWSVAHNLDINIPYPSN